MVVGSGLIPLRPKESRFSLWQRWAKASVPQQPIQLYTTHLHLATAQLLCSTKQCLPFPPRGGTLLLVCKLKPSESKSPNQTLLPEQKVCL